MAKTNVLYTVMAVKIDDSWTNERIATAAAFAVHLSALNNLKIHDTIFFRFTRII